MATTRTRITQTEPQRQQPPEQTAGGISKRFLYGKHDEWVDKRNRFGIRAAYKALDMPMDDDMNIQSGMTWKELAAGGSVITALLALALWAYSLFAPSPSLPENPPPAVNPPVASTPLEDRDYEVRFWDRDGNPIHVDRYATPSEEGNHANGHTHE